MEEMAVLMRRCWVDGAVDLECSSGGVKALGREGGNEKPMVCGIVEESGGGGVGCQDGRVVKAVDLRSTGGISAWVRTPLLAFMKGAWCSV